MEKFKKYIFIFIIIGLLILVIIFVVSRNRGQVQIPQKISAPTLVDRSVSAYQVKSALVENDLKLPTSMPLYVLDKQPFVFEEVSKLAKNLGFTNEVQKLNDVNSGVVYLWINSTGSLRVIPSTHIVDYSFKDTSTSNLNRNPFDENQLLQTAEKFLVDKGFIGSKENLDLLRINYLKIDGSEIGYSTTGSADLAQVMLKQLIDGYQIVNPTPGVGTISVMINKNGNVTLVYYDGLNPVVSKTNYTIKIFKELVDNIDKAKIQSVSVSGHDSDISILQSVKEVVVNKAEVAYLKEDVPSQSLLQPIFLLQGTATLQDGSQVQVVLYLPAISNQYFLATPTPTS